MPDKHHPHHAGDIMLRVLLCFSLFAMIMAAACTTEDPTASATTAARAATSRASATASPTRTPTPSGPTRTFPPPFTGNIITPTPVCEDSAPRRLILNERGVVLANDPEPLNVRSGPGLGFNILDQIEVLTVFTVLDGPRCGADFTWYLIEADGIRGWIAEGEPAFYYVGPYLPG
jgi:uncharacterized protein YgiM (DUF1202 family)